VADRGNLLLDTQGGLLRVYLEQQEGVEVQEEDSNTVVVACIGEEVAGIEDLIWMEEEFGWSHLQRQTVNLHLLRSHFCCRRSISSIDLRKRSYEE